MSKEVVKLPKEVLKVRKNYILVGERKFYYSTCKVCGAVISRKPFHPLKYCPTCRDKVEHLRLSKHMKAQDAIDLLKGGYK